MLTDLAAGALGNVTHVVLSSMQDDPQKAARSFRQVSFAAACVGFPAFAGAALIIDDVIGLLFAEKWSGAILATQLFCLTGLIATLGIVQGALIRSQGYPNWWFYYLILQQVGTIAAIALTLSVDATVTAVVAAMVLKTYLFWPVSLLMTVRILKCSLGSYLNQMRGPAIATLAMVAALLLFQGGGGWGHVGSQILLGVFCYVVILFSVCRVQITEVLRLIRKAKTA